MCDVSEKKTNLIREPTKVHDAYQMNVISNVQQILTSSLAGCMDGASSRIGSDSLNTVADKLLLLSVMTAVAVVVAIESNDDESSLAIDCADVDVDFGMMLIIDFLIMAFNRLLSSVVAICSGDTNNMHDFRRHFSIILSFIFYIFLFYCQVHV